jgi:hypothetical protein
MLDETDDETRDMEALLGRYQPAAPQAALRARVVREARKRSQWAYLEGIAALMLVGMNLAQIGASVTPVFRAPRIDVGRTEQIAAEIDRLGLPLDKGETRMMAEQLAAGERLVRLPQIHGAMMNDPSKGVLP